MERGRISTLQLTTLLVMFIISSSTLLIPSLLTIHAKQDAWLSVLLGLTASTPLVYMYVTLGSKQAGLSIVEYSERVLGRTAGFVVNLLLLMYFILLTSALLRQLGDMITTLVLPETPIQAIIFLMMVVIIFAVRTGLESFARASQIFFPWVMLFIVLLLVSLVPEIELKHIFPVLEEGLPRVIKGAWNLVGIPFLDMVIFLMVCPYVKEQARVGQAFLQAFVVGGLIVFLVTTYAIVVIGPESAAHAVYPVFSLAQKVSIGNFIQRIEVLVGGVWFISLFFKITVCFYAATLAMAQMFRLQSLNTPVYPLALLVCVNSLVLLPSSIYFLHVAAEIWTPSVLLYGLFIPLVLLTVQKLRRLRSGRRSGAAEGTEGGAG
ncbi:endospore germination permease [Paenibacillus sp. YYML68]|uniref:GerAB/ArcD/ProY family transporter n=1 Tax=Paenibacillus sp. YYML68 TaxID=2909250 RepID=UPI00248FCCD7|nr:endospore germination permease [Paenibacillus sp. YYML68]